MLRRLGQGAAIGFQLLWEQQHIVSIGHHVDRLHLWFKVNLSENCPSQIYDFTHTITEVPPWYFSDAHYLTVYTHTLRFNHLDSENWHDIQLRIGNGSLLEFVLSQEANRPNSQFQVSAAMGAAMPCSYWSPYWQAASVIQSKSVWELSLPNS